MKNYNVPENIFNDLNYSHYIIQYQGDIKSEFEKQKDHYVILINDKYAIISINKNIDISTVKKQFKSIVYIKTTSMYTLEEISPLEASQADFLQLSLPLSLTGKNVNVAIIDTGIDYLSDEFMNRNGETRIECIWDQTIISSSNEKNSNVPFGTVYEKNKIQEAINANKAGKNPYEIVPTKDEIAHGTHMSGLIGATGKNPKLKGIVPECDLVIIKLMEDISYKTQLNIKVPIFNITTVFAALEFIYQYALEHYKPMIIFFPLGSNLGTHKGSGILSQYIASICKNSGIAMITSVGNERANGEHTSGSISKTGESSIIELDISPEQNDLLVEIWIDLPNIMSLDIISPYGESSGIINPLINTSDFYTFIFEKTSMKVNYYFPEEFTGDEFILIDFHNLEPGVWKLRLTGNYILNGKYNVWIPQAGITVGNTRFSSPDIYGTITNPANSKFIITAAGYNQNNNNIVNYSGMGFIDDYVDVIDVAAGCVNALTVSPNNTTAIVNGTSVAGAVVAGACAMLFQWGIVDGNDPYMYSQTLKTYLARGTIKRKGDIYPNPQWGYGILNILNMFQNMT